MKPSIGACIVAFALAVPEPVHRQSWCAAPRPNEPLLADATRLLGSSDPESVRQRKKYGLNGTSPVTVIRDEPTCRRASHAYWEVMIFDATWHRLTGYGAGADDLEALVSPAAASGTADTRARGDGPRMA